MNNDHWLSLSQRASAALPPDFANRTLVRAVSERRWQRDLATAAITLSLCVSSTAGFWAWSVYQQHQASLALWREAAAITLAMERL